MDLRTQALLQQAFRRESLSMLRYVGEAYPWAGAEGGAALARLRDIEAEDRAETTASAGSSFAATSRRRSPAHSPAVS